MIRPVVKLLDAALSLARGLRTTCSESYPLWAERRLSARTRHVWCDWKLAAYNPTVLGTPIEAADLRFASYLAIGFVSLFKWWQDPMAEGSDGRFRAGGWFLLGAFWIALAVFQYRGGIHELTDYGRGEAYVEGWYSGRRSIQRIIIAAVVVLGLVGAFAAMVFAPRPLRRYRSSYSLTLLAVGFVLVRSVSLHSVDAALGHEILDGLRLGDAVEISGAWTICATVWLAGRAKPGGTQGRGRAPVE